MPANPVNWFEIPVLDMERAKTFYMTVFDLKIEEQSMGPRLMGFFPMQMDAVGAGGALVKEEGFVPSQTGILIYFSVPDIEATLARVTANGGKMLIPKTSIGEYGFVGYFKDTEGNRLALHTMA